MTRHKFTSPRELSNRLSIRYITIHLLIHTHALTCTPQYDMLFTLNMNTRAQTHTQGQTTSGHTREHDDNRRVFMYKRQLMCVQYSLF